MKDTLQTGKYTSQLWDISMTEEMHYWYIEINNLSKKYFHNRIDTIFFSCMSKWEIERQLKTKIYNFINKTCLLIFRGNSNKTILLTLWDRFSQSRLRLCYKNKISSSKISVRSIPQAKFTISNRIRIISTFLFLNCNNLWLKGWSMMPPFKLQYRAMLPHLLTARLLLHLVLIKNN